MYSALVTKCTKYYCRTTYCLYDLLTCSKSTRLDVLRTVFDKHSGLQGMLHCPAERVVSDVSKDRNGFIFGVINQGIIGLFTD